MAVDTAAPSGIVPEPPPCHYCDVGNEMPEQAWMLRDELWSAAGPPLVDEPGWAIVMLRRHAEGLADLTDDELESLGPAAARISEAITLVTGAARVYVAIFLEANRHFHMLLTPRAEDAPGELRGPSLLVNRAQVRDQATAAQVAARIRAQLGATSEGRGR